MSELGILWQTGAISPAYEHFITNLVKTKIHIQTEILQRSQGPTKTIHFCTVSSRKRNSRTGNSL